MTAIKNVAIAGASGRLGPSILRALLDSGFSVTVLTRASSASTFPAEAIVKAVDYDDVGALTRALQGIDAVVSALSSEMVGQQRRLVDAAIAAGAQRFIPSEFGSDTAHPRNVGLAVFAGKIETRAYLEEQAAAGRISWTGVQNGLFLDWSVQIGWGLDLRKKKTTLYDGGNARFTTTTLAEVGQAVVGVLQHPEETANRIVRVASAQISQQRLLELAQQTVGTEGWEVTEAVLKDITQAAVDGLKTEGPTMANIIGLLYEPIYSESSGSVLAPLDNELLGVKTYSDDDIVALLKSLAQ